MTAVMPTMTTDPMARAEGAAVLDAREQKARDPRKRLHSLRTDGDRSAAVHTSHEIFGWNWKLKKAMKHSVRCLVFKFVTRTNAKGPGVAWTDSWRANQRKHCHEKLVI
jgi:hypothetical protein